MTLTLTLIGRRRSSRLCGNCGVAVVGRWTSSSSSSPPPSSPPPSSPSSSSSQLKVWLNSLVSRWQGSGSKVPSLTSSPWGRWMSHRWGGGGVGGGVGVRSQVSTFISSYEDMIGIRQVKNAQGQVLQAEMRFGEAQEARRGAQRELDSVELRLREVRNDLERTPRGENHYLDLVKREMELIREERVLRERFERQENEERELFGGLSSALRASHESERAQREKTKYWSVVGSLVGAVLGILGTTISSRLKMNELKSLVKDTVGQRAGRAAEREAELEHKVAQLLAQLNGLLLLLEDKSRGVVAVEGGATLASSSSSRATAIGLGGGAGGGDGGEGAGFGSRGLAEVPSQRRDLVIATTLICTTFLLSTLYRG